jgi:hypothetical protein
MNNFSRILFILLIVLLASYTVRTVLLIHTSGMPLFEGYDNIFKILGISLFPFTLLCSLFLSNNSEKPIFEQPYKTVLAYFVLSALAYLLLHSENISTIISNLVIFVIPYLVYQTSKCIVLDINRKFIYWGLFVLFVFLCYVNFKVGTMLNSISSSGKHENSVVYLVISFFPCLLLIPNRFFHIIGYILTFIAILLSGRRSTFVSLVLSFLCYYTYDKDKSSGIKLIRILTILCMASIIVYFSFDFIKDSLTIQRLFTDTDDDISSGRIDIYMNVLDLILRSDYLSLIFGHGINAVCHYTKNGLSAHNDFLEIFFDYGLVGFALYITFIYKIFKTSFILYKRKSFYFYFYSSWCSVFLVLSSLSHLFIYPYFYFLAFGLGVCTALSKQYHGSDNLLR